MPIYEYKCHKCDYVFEELRSMSEYKVPCDNPCPNCQEEGNVQRHISSAPDLGYSMGYGAKMSDNFKDRLREIKKNVGGQDGKENINQHI